MNHCVTKLVRLKKNWIRIQFKYLWRPPSQIEILHMFVTIPIPLPKSLISPSFDQRFIVKLLPEVKKVYRCPTDPLQGKISLFEKEFYELSPSALILIFHT